MKRNSFLKKLGLGALASTAIPIIATDSVKNESVKSVAWYDEINDVRYPYDVKLYDPTTFEPMTKRIYKDKITGKVTIKKLKNKDTFS